MSEKITFPTNVPVPLVLQFLGGKLVASQFGGNQHLFTTTDGRIFFVSETVGEILAAQLSKLHVQKGEPIEILKAEVPSGNGRKSIQWLVNKVDFAPGEQPDGTFAVPNAKPGATADTPAPLVPGATQTPATTGSSHGKPNGKATASRPSPLPSTTSIRAGRSSCSAKPRRPSTCTPRRSTTPARPTATRSSRKTCAA